MNESQRQRERAPRRSALSLTRANPGMPLVLPIPRRALIGPNEKEPGPPWTTKTPKRDENDDDKDEKDDEDDAAAPERR